MPKVIVGMSGGVDSAVTALLLKEKGYEVVGATLKLFESYNTQDALDAKDTANKLNVPHDVYDMSAEFSRYVIDYFCNTYFEGATPNPCIVCNINLKFGALLKKGLEMGCDYIATGHYAQIENINGRYLLKKAKDPNKDQSYVLYGLSQEQLSRTIFPLGGYLKTEIKSIAAQNGFVSANKPESQDICFIKNTTYADFIENYCGKNSPVGDFIDTKGNILGRHKGILHYTIGQGKRLGIALGKRTFVVDKNAADNTVTLGDKEDLLATGLIASDVNFISIEKLSAPMKVTVKTRYKQQDIPAIIEPMDNNQIKVLFETPVLSVTKGQAVVFYDDDYVVGGGTITSKI